MKKNITIGIVAGLAIIGISIIVMASNRQTPVTSQNSDSSVSGSQNTNSSNPASKIEVGEISLTKENWDTEIKNYKGVALVDMYLPTCSHCQKMGPIFSEVAKDNKDKYKFGKIDMNVNPDIGSQYNIESVPAFLYFKDGKEVARIIGETTKDNLIAKLQEISK